MTDREHAYVGAIFEPQLAGYVGYCKCGHVTSPRATKQAALLELIDNHVITERERQGAPGSAPAGKAPAAPDARHLDQRLPEHAAPFILEAAQ